MIENSASATTLETATKLGNDFPVIDIPSDMIKTDRIGRIRVSDECREMLLDKFEQSAIAGTEFAKLCGIKYQTFATWVQKRKRKRGEYVTETEVPQSLLSSIVEVDVSTNSASPSDTLRVDLPSGASIEITSPAQIDLAASLLTKLNASSQC